MIEQRQARLDKAIKQMKEYQTQQEGLTKWMDEMDVFLHAEDPAVGDIPALQAQLQESKGVQEDIKTLQLNVRSINSIAESFMDEAEPQFREEHMALEAQFIDFQSQTLKVKDWLTRAENILTSHSRLSEQQHVLSPHSETIKQQTLLMQMNELHSQVDNDNDNSLLTRGKISN
ncbi:dystrophin-like isoform X2 [Pomacea canaliculata]|uniref:dystrophin-like isoform X2 n=1 Tax=Pomacea canaliculata TaxID=400727 RepID=UPI000D7260ED|nr:dystrophin-like isoform X2 [Pomacea canaliculata]